MPSVRYRMIRTMFRMIGINKKLKKDEPELRKFMESYIPKQDKIRVPAEKMKKNYDFRREVIEGTDCYITRQKGTKPDRALLYVFGGGYFIPCDPGDFTFAGQFADHTGREVWFPIYPLAPRYKLVDSIESVLAVYREMLKHYRAEDITMFGTSSGGGLCLSLLMYIKEKYPEIPYPSHLVLQSPGLQVPPSETQKKMYFDWGSKEDYYKTSTPLVRKIYPSATVIIRENYAHCEYMAKHPTEYLSFIEEHIG